MINEFLQIARLCDRRGEWTEEEWTRTLINCISKGQYIVKIKNKEIIAFSCWLFLKDLNKIDDRYIEDKDGKIAYVQCAYVKNNGNGILRKMIKEGIEKHKEATHIFFCDDRLNNEKFLMPIRRSNEKANKEII